MTLLSPMFLWAFAALVPLAAVYLLKVRPSRKPAVALFLWQQVYSERRATSLFRRLRDVLSLLLMALALSAMVLAMTRPQLGTDQRRDLLILIDRSASMSANWGGLSRFAAARREARAIIRAMGGEQRAAVASIDHTIRYHAHMTDDPRRLTEAIDGLEPTAAPLNAEALARFADRTDWAGDVRVILISDGVLGGVAVPGDVELLKVGSAVENVGIVAADIQRSPEASEAMNLYVRLASSYDEPMEVDLHIEHDRALRRVIPIMVEPGLNDGEVYTLEGDAGAWRLELDVDDALAMDDRAHLVVPHRQPVRVAVAAEDRYFFEHSVLAFSRSGSDLELVDENPDVALAQGVPADAPLSVVFEPRGEASLWPGLGDPTTVVAPRVRVDDHPALRFLDVSNLTFTGAREVELPEGALTLVESEGGVPLIWQMRSAERTTVVVNLDPAASDLFYRTHFPVLVHGIVTHLSRRSEPLAATYRPGAVVPIPGGSAEVETRIDVPGEREPRLVRAGRMGPLQEPGFHRVENDSGAWWIGVSLAAREETLLNNDDALDTTEALSRGVPPSTWLLWVAVVVLIAESLLYHRRKVG